MTSLLDSVNKATGNIVVQADAIPYYHADYYTAVEMSERLYNNKSTVESGLVTGTQWDMMMKYLEDNEIAVKGTECNWGNIDNVSIDGITGYYTGVTLSWNVDTDGFKDGSKIVDGKAYTTDGAERTYTLLTTGASEKVKKMNLYDVLGNLWEWTDEAAYINSTDNTVYSTKDYNTFVLRGAGFNYSKVNSKACYRSYDYAVSAEMNVGFRPVLYIK